MGARSLILVALCLKMGVPLGLAQQTTKARTSLRLETGKEIFEAACAACHGSDTKGQPQAILGFHPPATFPDFTDCPTATPEPDIQ
jgi:mono/diheme cytochrome c family protein